MSESEAAVAPPAAPQSPPRRITGPSIVLVALALACVVLAWTWIDTRRELRQVRSDVALRLERADVDARESRILAKRAEEEVREATGKLGLLEARVGESKSQQIALEQLYQQLSRGSDEWMLAEVEQALNIASQQLQLAGNVQAALYALQSADARLARADRPLFLPLRRSLSEDITRLRGVPNLDIPGLMLRLDPIIAGVEGMTLLSDGRPQQPADEPAAGATVLSRVGAMVWQEVRQLVRVQRLDRADQALLTPEAAYYLRENIKLRLLSARVALLQRNESVFKSDISSSRAALGRFFDTRQKEVAAAIATLAEFERASLNVELPTLANSIAVARSLKLAGDKR